MYKRFSMSYTPLGLHLLASYFRRVRIPPSFETIRRAPTEFTIVTQSRAPIFEALLLSFARRSGLAGVRYCDAEALQRPENREANTLYWLSLHDLEMLNVLTPVVERHRLTTFNIFERRGPIRSNPSHKINRWRLAGIFLAARILVIIFGEPVTFTDRRAMSGKHLARHLKLDFYRNLKLVRGTPFQSIETQERLLLGGAEFEREVSIVAARQKQSPDAVRRQARRSFYHLAANPRRLIYVMTAPIVKFLINRLFNGVSATGLDRLVAANKEHTVIIAPMHRSHLDYILVGSKLYESNLNPPVVCAGINLSFFPFGFFIRSLGGYFVKRNARHDRVHAMLLRRYVSYLVKRGHLHEFFIEGGRSRNGRMRAPRLGLLSIMVNAYLRGQRREIAFVPVSITYENVIEDSVYAQENTGQKKKRESLGSLIAARDLLRKRYGEVILNFGTPIALSTEVARQRTARPGKAVDERELIASVAFELTRRIRIQTNPSLTSLVAGALMMTPRYGLSRSALAAAVRRLATIVALTRTIDPEVGAATASLEGFLAGRDHILDAIGRGEVVSSGEVLGETTFYIEGKRRFTADFYRNATLHLFLPGSLMALSELMYGFVDLELVARFYPIFQADYLLGPKAHFETELAQHFSAYRAHGLIMAGPHGPVFADRSLGTFNPALMLAAIETLLWIYDNLAATPGSPPVTASVNTSTQPLKVIPYARFLTTLQEDYERLVYVRPAGRTEAASRTNLETALESLHQRGVVSIVEGNGQPRDIEVLREKEEEVTLLRSAENAILAWFGTGAARDEAPGEQRPPLRLVDPGA